MKKVDEKFGELKFMLYLCNVIKKQTIMSEKKSKPLTKFN